MKIEIYDLLIDDTNSRKMRENGVSVAMAFEVLDDAPRPLPNHVEDGAYCLLVGPTSLGFVTLPIDPTSDNGLWRPRTGYPSKPADLGGYQRMGRKGR